MNQDLKSLLKVISIFSSRGLCQGTGGNFSIRIDNQTFLITESGKDKGNLSEEDFIRCDLKTGLSFEPERKPSAEALLHALIYQEDSTANTVLHTHSIASTVMSKKINSNSEINFTGYEMQKTFFECKSHLDTVKIPVFVNSQDMNQLSGVIREEYFKKSAYGLVWPGFILSGHGIYCWGKSVAEAQRHLEGAEFLLSCELSHSNG